MVSSVSPVIERKGSSLAVGKDGSLGSLSLFRFMRREGFFVGDNSADVRSGFSQSLRT